LNINNNTNNNKKYILLVDDEKDTLYTFDLYLKSLGFSTISFVNPVEALNYFNKNFNNCILVIADYNMPQMSGIDMIKKIREKDWHDKIKIIITTATSTNNIINYDDKLAEYKVDKFLEKPISLEKLKNEIEMLLSF
jgi:CheY-like chemotaxis protein